ncbi:MAG: LysM peptidoglycan-binding domain-containing protein [Melioribacteraceae bacterium]|nr:LysM peptidoglycan-binding domain-containing protein [Melioribacteraceae bacterium]MCF8353088.1 LysM peptidoglycan-binding domain-containing protein [Melioribacteraceae bacterium]MCF8392766.1 LysM peptidoglycan-binding domain-containing protein [Melioribacteraceae bacterium]MCF8418297.1 LysM peptidoglycan-binding domain-containing protein [Melioribacteraceae bacterium]
MKFNKYFAGLLTLLLLFSVSIFAQEELTEEEWQKQINQLTEKKASLSTELDQLKSDVENLRKTNAELQTYEECMDELYAMVGATKADIMNFRKKVDELSSKIDNRVSPKDDRQAELDQLKANKISALPEFFDKVHNQLQRKLDAWQEKPTEILYTVVKGDCLWNIAKKKEHYANPFAWPKIYNANRDQIKNPDLIYPKQIFKIPNLTEEEKAKYDKAMKNYKAGPKQ